MRNKSDVVAEIRDTALSPQPRIAVESKSPVVGYFCSYIPPEILSAAGLYPIRLRGAASDDSGSGDAYLSHLTCSFARHVTAAILDGHFDFLAGQISVNTCDHIRRANDVIVAKSNLDYHGYLSVPRSFREDLMSWYKDELDRLITSIGQHFKITITDESLESAIEKYNRVRDRLSKLDSLRMQDPPRLSGTQFFTAAVAARILPPEKLVELADELIAAANSEEPITGIRVRVILIGGELDEPKFVEVIESQGAHVAGDLLCYGVRGLGRPVLPSANPIESIARAYLYQIPCARMMGEFPRRYNEMRELYRDAKAKGVIYQRIKFCQIWSTEVHNLKHRFEQDPLPMLILDREYGLISTGQIKTRVQAFIERLEGKGE